MAERQFELTRDTIAVAYTLFTAWINEDGTISQTEKSSGKETV
jgi:hypothetical protein